MSHRPSLSLHQLVLSVSALMAMSACSGAPEAAPLSAPTTAPALATVLVVVTATPMPPTATPSPPPTDSFNRWTADQAVQALLAAGLEAQDARPMTPDDYGMAPMTAAQGIRFLIPSLCADCGGRMYSFDSLQDLELMRAYYEELARSSAIFFSWIFVKDNILLQINGDLPESQALLYETALDALK